MRSLVPAESQVMLACLRQVCDILLVAIADVAGPYLSLIEPVGTAGREISVQKRTGLDAAVLIIFGETSLAACDRAIPAGIVQEIAPADFKITVQPPHV